MSSGRGSSVKPVEAPCFLGFETVFFLAREGGGRPVAEDNEAAKDEVVEVPGGRAAAGGEAGELHEALGEGGGAAAWAGGAGAGGSAASYGNMRYVIISLSFICSHLIRV